VKTINEKTLEAYLYLLKMQKKKEAKRMFSYNRMRHIQALLQAILIGTA
jgi:hypothetical protein